MSILEAIGMLFGVSLTILVVLVIYGGTTDAEWFLKFSDIFGQGPTGAAGRLDAAAHYDFERLPSLCTPRGYQLICTRNVLAFLERDPGDQTEYSIVEVQGHRADVAVITRKNPRVILRLVHEGNHWKLDDYRSDDRREWMSTVIHAGAQPAGQ